jgi:hypothetical protein
MSAVGILPAPESSGKAAMPVSPTEPGLDHDHDHAGDHDHAHETGSWWAQIFHLHSHDDNLARDPGLEGSELGIWALKVSLVSLFATDLFQVIIVVISPQSLKVMPLPRKSGTRCTTRCRGCVKSPFTWILMLRRAVIRPHSMSLLHIIG